ncbi:hypothetical protein WJX73_000575 [Symbiochloris irregularis]|uniref:Pentapeptide repeat-containing protein n=1 Tax=Symbiochloris irregularis TaxID=706552 RepID=A0AAW1NJK0_9CHLO
MSASLQLRCTCGANRHTPSKAAPRLAAQRSLAVSGGGGLGTSLAYKDFAGKNFQSQKFYKADLRGTNFANADLTGANLFGAFAKDANFSGANLKLAVLESVDFDNADLSNAILEGAQITNARFMKTNIENTDWTDVLQQRAAGQFFAKHAGVSQQRSGRARPETRGYQHERNTKQTWLHPTAHKELFRTF